MGTKQIVLHNHQMIKCVISTVLDAQPKKFDNSFILDKTIGVIEIGVY
jgi:hypothetical protein